MNDEIIEWFRNRDPKLLMVFVHQYRTSEDHTREEYEWANNVYSMLKQKAEKQWFLKIKGKGSIAATESTLSVKSEDNQPTLANLTSSELMEIAYKLHAFALKVVKSETHKGGYVNEYGVRVPNQCNERDMKGRNLDKVYRNLKPGEIMDEDTIEKYSEVK